MHKLKSDIIHALQSVQMTTDKMVEVSNICDDYYNALKDNISMAFQDAYHWHKTKTKKRPNLNDIHEISNVAAKHFLDLLCKGKE